MKAYERFEGRNGFMKYVTASQHVYRLHEPVMWLITTHTFKINLSQKMASYTSELPEM